MPGMLSSVCLIDCESMKTGVVARQELPLDWSFSSDGNKQYRQRVGTKKRLKVLLRHHAFGPAQKTTYQILSSSPIPIPNQHFFERL